MSDLQILLIIVGSFIIAGVIAYNYVQDRNLRNKITRDFVVPHEDVLTEDFHIDADAYINKEQLETEENLSPNQLKKIDQAPELEIHSKENIEQADFYQTVESQPNINQLEHDKIQSEVADVLPLQEQITVQYAHEKPDLKLNIDKIEKNDFESNFSDISKVDRLKDNQEITRSTPNSKEFYNGTSLRSLETPAETQEQSLQLPQYLHPQIDLTAVLFANSTINSLALSNLASEIVDINQIMVLYGLEDDGKWHLVTNSFVEKQFKQVSCSIQLADRGGPISRQLLNKFQFTVENMGAVLNAHVEWQTTGDAMQQALTLDQFCIEVDQMISVHLVQNENAIHGTKLKGIAEANGLNLNEDGKFYYYGSLNSLPIFSIVDSTNQAFTHENLRQNVFKSLSFQLEIPKATNSEQVFNQMIILAQKMAMSLGASLVDDKHKPLNDLQIEKIKQQLKIIHAKMVARNILPGSSGALRLFN